MGADIIINTNKVDLHAEVMRLTNGDGVPRLVEASGASQLVNNCFKLLQKVISIF
jgi:threonine dehydrogenase-like Zn-dependent dehydrogenase